MRFIERLPIHKLAGRNLYYLLAGVLFLLSLLAGFYLALPQDTVNRRLVDELESRLPLRVEIGEASLQPLLTLTGRRIDLQSTTLPDNRFRLDSFRLSPRWSGLLTGSPGIDGELVSTGGNASFSLQQDGPLTARADALPFDMFLYVDSPVRLAGLLTLLEITSATPLQKDTDSRVELSFDRLAVHGLESLLPKATAPLKLGSLIVQATGRGSSFTIERLVVNGGDLELSGQGSLILSSKQPLNSRIDLDLILRATASLDPAMAELINLLGKPQQDGSYRVKLSGTLSRPRFKAATK